MMFDLSKQNFDITGELIIRKILESNTDFRFEFIKNDDKYGSDIKIFEYIIHGNEWSKEFLGFIEVEKATKWETIDIPQNWYCISFLMRKLFVFYTDGINGGFGTRPFTPQNNCDKTIYLKFNINYSNCFCQMKNFIIEKGNESNRNGTNNLKIRNDSYWELKKEDLIWGVKNCCDFIKDKFKIS